MKIYNPDSKCIKCGCGICKTKWMPSEYVDIGKLEPGVISDYMHRTCGNCGFEWDEKPLTDLAQKDSTQ